MNPKIIINNTISNGDVVCDNDARPLEKINQKAQQQLSDRILDIYTEISLGDSPIERILFTALMVEIEVGSHEHGPLLLFKKGKRFHPSFFDDCEKSALPLIVESQVNVLDWPVDFLISSKSYGGGLSRLVVECDGHDFHERTKAQAKKDRSRDRRLQQYGYTVFRFTGSEIWSDPGSCVDQIIEWAVDAYFGPPLSRVPQ